MTIIIFLTELAGATMLLLYAVRMVRTGIERAFGPSFRRVVTASTNPLRAATTGLVMALILQSSAAVGLLVAGFTGTKALAFATGLAVVLGADLGSALLIQVLSFKLEWLVPVLLAFGGGFFIKSERRGLKQAGRIILGIAFILLSLRFLRETMDPIRDSAFLPSLAGYLEKDFLTAFIVGAVLAWLMHSSVAVILMCVTLVAISAVPVVAGTSLILGANLGSAMIPIWLTRGMTPISRHVPIANFIVRGTGAIVAVLIVNLTPALTYLGGLDSSQTLINVHMLFNFLLLGFLPFCAVLHAPVSRLLPVAPPVEEAVPHLNRSVLDASAAKTPRLALLNMKREVLRMAQVAETMLSPVMGLYERYDRPSATSVIDRELIISRALDDIRKFSADIPADMMQKHERHQIREITEYAIEVQTAGNIVAKVLMPLAREKSENSIRFSEAGLQELLAMHERVLANMALAFNVLISDDLESARLLLEEKAEMTRAERSSRKQHLKRLSKGMTISFESSDIHLDTLRALREFNSRISSVAYPILHRGGQLLETRLIQNIDTKDND